MDVESVRPCSSTTLVWLTALALELGPFPRDRLPYLGLQVPRRGAAGLREMGRQQPLACGMTCAVVQDSSW